MNISTAFLLSSMGKRVQMQAKEVKWALLFFFLLPSLWKGAGNDGLFAQFNFVHITDLHVSDAASYVNGCDLGGLGFQCYLNEFVHLNPKPAFVIASGDLSNIGDNSSNGMYPTLTQFLFPNMVLNPNPGDYFIDSAHTIPIYFTPGNHDYYTTTTPPLNGNLTFYSKYISPDTDYAVTTSSAVILCMRSGYDDDRPVWVDPNITSPEGSGISNEQCTWLRNQLSLAGSKRKIIVMHHPPVNAVGTNFDGTPFTGGVWDEADGSILNNRATLLNICDSNNVDIVLAGHVHQNVVASRAGNVVNENWTTGTRYVQTAAALNRSYRIITVDSSAVMVGLPLRSCIPSDVNELSETGISVYPNPSNGKFQVLSLGVHVERIEIFNLLGEQVYIATSLNRQTSPQSSINGSNDIDLSSATKGIYFIKIYTGEKVYTKKIVVE